MTPKEKAEELVYRFAALLPEYGSMSIRKAKECALISVDREYKAIILEYSEMYEFCPDIAAHASICAEKELEQVKQEIEKL